MDAVAIVSVACSKCQHGWTTDWRDEQTTCPDCRGALTVRGEHLSIPIRGQKEEL